VEPSHYPAAHDRPRLGDAVQVGLISLLDGLVYGMLLFMLASGLTLILSMMGVLNFAHASIYMLGAYFAYQIDQWIGFWPALVIAPVVCGAIGAAIEIFGLRRVHHNGHIAELLFTFGLVFIIGRGVQMTWGMLPMPYRVPALLDFPLFTLYGENFPAYRGFMLLVSAGMLLATWLLLKKTRIGLIIQASLTHPGMVSALGHDVPLVFTTVFAGGSFLAGLAGVIAGNYLTTESGMADAMGPIVFVVVIFGGLGSLAGCFIASILMGMVQTFSVVIDWSLADLIRPLGVTIAANDLFGEILNIPVSRIGPLVPYALLILILVLRPRGLLGTRET
jgi:branched-chain amino acid transport system permease protein